MSVKRNVTVPLWSSAAKPEGRYAAPRALSSLGGTGHASQSPPDGRFRNGPREAYTRVMQARKTVSILFCDVVDSTPLGEQLDPESLQRVMSRWFAEARAIVERHGGTVEKFIGDEVMAVFGVPVVHEDDALRAVRSAAALRERLETLNDELEALFGVRLEVRIGVNTGEVVVGDPASGGTFVTGEPVNLAKRLEQAAAPGQILIGKSTYPLVANAVQAGPLESFHVKGKREAVSRWQIEQVDTGAAGV